jgi:hypothetical protein
MGDTCRRLAAAVVAAALGLGEARARAERPPPPRESLSAQALLRRGIALYREASYAGSVAALEQARAARLGTLEPPERVECAFYLAADYVALGSLGAARGELREVMGAMPDYEPPPFTSPKVSALLAEVRAESDRAPRMKPLPPRRVGEASLELRFEVSRTGGRAFGAVFYRMRGEQPFSEAPLGHVGDDLATQVALQRSGTIEYYALAQAPSGAMAAGSPTRPLELTVQVRATQPRALVPPAKP